MIFDGSATDLDAHLQDSARLTTPMTVARMLVACAQEARYLAHVLAEMDQAFASLVLHSSAASPVLQRIDLARQEAAGLAELLSMVAEDATPERELDPERVAGALALWSQHSRVHAVPGDR